MTASDYSVYKKYSANPLSISSVVVGRAGSEYGLPMAVIPDSFTGAIAAIEGIRDAAVLLNGPTGCKFYHGAMSETQMPRSDFIDPLYYSEEFYFGQPRVPVTYLDDYDYVFGATDKLEKILPIVARKGHGLIGVINSPGAALIGDDLLRFIKNANLPVPCIAVENTGFSQPLAWGFQDAVKKVLTRVKPRKLPREKDGVNLMGVSIVHHHWQGNVAELTTLLQACGIRVHTTICAGCTLAELENISSSQLNVVVHVEYADTLAPFMADRYGMNTYLPPDGAPVGFKATESWISGVCEMLDVSPAPALELMKGARQKSHEALNRFNTLTGLPKGATFGVDGDASMALPLVTWLYEYLGMVPLSVRVNTENTQSTDNLKSFLQKIDCAGAWQADMAHETPDVVFGSGAVIARLKLSGNPFTGIELSLPAGTYQHVIPKAYMGCQGALYLIERIINGLAGC